ncbi:MAG: hypothetical protein ACI9YG_000049, partial [Candidatus Azotimanducaceae bacterium]
MTAHDGAHSRSDRLHGHPLLGGCNYWVHDQDLGSVD